MKKTFIKLLFSALLAFGAISVGQSAFPVAETTTTTQAVNASSDHPIYAQTAEALKTATPEKSATTPKTSDRSSGKSQVIALILVLLVGGLGIHRFYLGYTWQGIVQLLTLGGCGIWAIIDLIRIVTGDLQPKDGTYDKTL